MHLPWSSKENASLKGIFKPSIVLPDYKEDV